MTKYRPSDLEIDIRKLSKYTRFIAAISAVAVIMGIVAGLIMTLTAYGPLSPMMVTSGIIIIFISLMVYWINQYFVYMGRGMTYLMREIRDKTGNDDAASPQNTIQDS
jgi:uncharacterized protein YacL